MQPSLNELVAGVLNIPAEELTEESGPNVVAQWDSLAHVTIAAAVEDTYGVELAMSEILGITSLGDLRRVLRARGVGV
jgi:acyl carrier protein